MKAPAVSIVMPAFNAEKFICESIKSAQAQTFTDWELLVVDDGSTDGTAAIVEMFLSDSRIQLLRQTNAGVSAARNAALRKSSGEWIAFLDADDVWFPEKLAEQMGVVHGRPDTNLVFTNYFLWDGTRDLELRFKTEKKFPRTDLEKRLIFHNLFGMSSVLLKRRTLSSVGEFDPAVAPAEDWDLWLRIAKQGINAIGVNKPLLRYRLWSGNASKNSLRMMQSNVRVLEKALKASLNHARRREYTRALQIARGNFELATASARISSAPEEVASAIGRAWGHCPSRLKWFLWFIGANWPGWLGGRLWRHRIYRAIQNKW